MEKPSEIVFLLTCSTPNCCVCQWTSVLCSCFERVCNPVWLYSNHQHPQFPQANEAGERAVHTIKGLLNKTDDPHLAILAYRSTPLDNGYI